MFTGTAANVLGLATVVRSHEAIICADSSHLQVDECAAPERFIGCKLLAVPTRDGKLVPDDITARLTGLDDEHRVQPRVVSITQSTELGTVYTADEIARLADTAHAAGMLLHVDGSRLANAAVHLDQPFRAFTTDVGVDLLSFGGTKNGLLGGEAVVFLNGLAPDDVKYIRKQGMQLGSKMRFLAAQFLALLETDLWRRNATQANRMASRLAAAVEGIPGLRVTHDVQANVVFATVPQDRIAALQAASAFYVWEPAISEVRWMTSWDTTEEDVDAFAATIREILGAPAAVMGASPRP